MLIILPDFKILGNNKKYVRKVYIIYFWHIISQCTQIQYLAFIIY